MLARSSSNRVLLWIRGKVSPLWQPESWLVNTIYFCKLSGGVVTSSKSPARACGGLYPGVKTLPSGDITHCMHKKTANSLRVLQRGTYFAGAYEQDSLPVDVGDEVAFCGRSNAGKSSLINALCGSKILAHTSKTPGKTCALQFFRMSSKKYLVDCPGYGYAKVADATRRFWKAQMEDYLCSRRSLRAVVMVVDCRRGWGALDRQMLAFLKARRNIETQVVLSKCDKLTQQENFIQQREYTLQEIGACQHVSARNMRGIEVLGNKIVRWLDIDT